jgi:hypothetical protein
MIPVETIPGMGKREIKENEGVKSSMIYLIYCKNFCKYHNVLQQNNKIWGIKRKEVISHHLQ